MLSSTSRPPVTPVFHPLPSTGALAHECLACSLTRAHGRIWGLEAEEDPCSRNPRAEQALRDTEARPAGVREP